MSQSQRAQLELPLPAAPAGDDEPLVPAHAQRVGLRPAPRLPRVGRGLLGGQRRHRRRPTRPHPADKPGAAPPSPDDFAEGAPDFRTRAVTLSSQRLGLVARIDVLEGEDGLVRQAPYRPILADSAVIGAINNGEIGADDFITAGPGCNLKRHARRNLIAAYERRLDQETTHPAFGYRLSMRRLIHVQARLLVRHLLGETPDYPHYLPR